MKLKLRYCVVALNYESEVTLKIQFQIETYLEPVLKCEYANIGGLY